MSALVAAWDRLANTPRSLDTSSGKPMAVATLAVDVADPREGDDAPPLWLGIVAFNHQADALLKHGKGECLSVSGRLQRRTYTDSSGQQREQLQCVADSLVSARTTRPGGGSSKQAAADRAQRPLKRDGGR